MKILSCDNKEPNSVFFLSWQTRVVSPLLLLLLLVLCRAVSYISEEQTRVEQTLTQAVATSTPGTCSASAGIPKELQVRSAADRNPKCDAREAGSPLPRRKIRARRTAVDSSTRPGVSQDRWPWQPNATRRHFFFFYIPSLVFRRLVLLGTNVIHSTIDWLLVQENLEVGLVCNVYGARTFVTAWLVYSLARS